MSAIRFATLRATVTVALSVLCAALWLAPQGRADGLATSLVSPLTQGAAYRHGAIPVRPDPAHADSATAGSPIAGAP
jgi:hypothetical protein